MKINPFIECLGYLDPDGLLDLSGSFAEKAQKPSNFPKKNS